ncbi:MAG: hypothetical protein ABW159_15275 [Candidatus Thiodiazotropha sp.]
MVVHIIAQGAGEGIDSDSHCDAVLVGNVAEWIKNPQTTESKLTQPLPGLEVKCRVSKQRLDAIRVDFLDKEEEIHMIANMLAK